MLKTATVVFEDEWILVVNKKPGVVVNRSQTTRDDTLQDDLTEYFGPSGDDLGIGDRAGIVHRLDRETSGLLAVAKSQKAFDNLQAQFKAREVTKEYTALVHGKIADQSGSIEAKIARIGKFGKFGVVRGRPSFAPSTPLRATEGKEAKTDYQVEARYVMSEAVLTGLIPDQGSTLTKARLRYLKSHAKDYALLRVLPKTGRTHQIRVHLKSIGHPVVSDLIYGPGRLSKFDLLWCPRLFLHAARLEFAHPKTKKRVTFESDLPKDLKEALARLTTDN